MKIVLGCDPLLQPLTGLGHYTHQLGLGLNQHSDIGELDLFAHGKFFDHELLKRNSFSETISKSNNGLLSKVRAFLASSNNVVKFYQKSIPYVSQFALRNHSDFLFHSPNFILPPFDGRKVTTIHDLSTIKFPHFHPAVRVDFVNNAIEEALQNTDHIITDSVFVKNEIIDTFGEKPSRITAIPLGASSAFYPRSVNECNRLLSTYDLTYKSYFLFVSTLEPRKNIVNLLDAFKNYRQQTPNGRPLILIGAQGWNNESILNKLSYLESKGWAQYLGYVPQNNIPIFYSGAIALLFPSTYEGFGLPVLEAMQSGTPVLTSEHSSMSEISDKFAQLVNPEDITDMTNSIITLAHNEELCGYLSDSGLIRAKTFSWNRCIAETIKVYRSLA